MKLKDKVAYVTGGNSGIGLAIAKEFVEQGARVAIVGRDQKTLQEAASALGDKAMTLQGDVSRLGDLESTYKETEKKLGKIDVVVANAGVAPVAPLDQTTEELFDKISDINFKGVFFTVQKSLPHLNDGASVVLISSVVNKKGMAGLSAYSATKAAVRSLARTFTTELVSRGIRVNVLSPGAIETPLFGKMGLPAEAVEEFGKNVSQQIPLQRFGQPPEMAKAALFLASDDSSYVTGSELVADGGFTQV